MGQRRARVVVGERSEFERRGLKETRWAVGYDTWKAQEKMGKKKREKSKLTAVNGCSRNKSWRRNAEITAGSMQSC